LLSAAEYADPPVGDVTAESPAVGVPAVGGPEMAEDPAVGCLPVVPRAPET